MEQVLQVFADGTAVITGAGSGIGEGLARVAARLGMNVVLADIAIDRAQAVADKIVAAGGKALAVKTDVTQVADLEALADAAYDTYGEVTLAINNAGIETLGYSWELSDEAWDRSIDINIRGVVHGSRVFARRMIAAGTKGHIANVASIGALGMMPTQTAYIMAKHAVLSFTECLFLEMELANAPIQVSVVVPAPVKSRIFDDAATAQGSDLVSRQRAKMQAMLRESGLTPEQAGEAILNGLATGDFWVSTDAGTTAFMARRRADYLAHQANPTLAEEARALVE
ncbi:SDR family NAD(P)-dependent oxidoreductase [Novosphingobium sp. KACC 22771]|uniref:SDR family NAD(P)-dependent oxidoreductase n=1 Tax=Novosphingobium sp. KACC 22771 TaxID=3025670 RepID=UPI0023672DA5|nr:SDR family NAD(P)-dependent oxidoreductase [Novosphingobium sp. KACC 22771]WDF74265.1 SDR family NAD(P)-dependent oxidoreductase [Novosphingobium sp. KACC 22771]